MYMFKKLQDSANPHDLSTVDFAVDKEASLPQIIEQFELFLKACGFEFDGILDITEAD